MGYSLFVTGLTHLDPARAWPGFTLFTTMSGDAFNLIDMQGRLVHRWTPPQGLKAYYATGLENGNLLAQCVDGTEEGGAAGGRASAALELDWDGNVVWDYRNPRLHHDHQRRPNGNTILIAAEPLDKETSSRFAHGDPQTKDGSILSESLIEVTPAGETVWEWHAHEHLDPEIEAYRTGSGGDQWLHANAVTELADGNLIFSFNTLSEVIIIDKPTGEGDLAPQSRYHAIAAQPDDADERQHPPVRQRQRAQLLACDRNRAEEPGNRLGVRGQPARLLLQHEHQRRPAATQRQHADL